MTVARSGRFAGELNARAWLQDFFGWHNDQHHHSGLALFTPADVFHGRVEAGRATRQAALDAAYAAHPERFPSGPPRVAMPPTEVHINPLAPEALNVSLPASEAPDWATAKDPALEPSGDLREAAAIVAMPPSQTATTEVIRT